jgi:nitroreductase
MSSNIDNILKIHLPKPKYKIIKEIASRWSPRHFSDKNIPQDHINRMIEASRWAPSGRNLQPWYFYYTQKQGSVYEKLFYTLSPYNQSWAKSAPLLILACVEKPKENPFAYYDLGAAVFSLVLQAQSLGYYCRQLALFDKQKVKEIFKLNKDLEPYTIIVIGKIGDYNKASEEIIGRELDPHPRKTNIAEELELPIK